MCFGSSGVDAAAVIDVDVVAAVLNRSRTWVPAGMARLPFVYFGFNEFEKSLK